MNQDLSKLNLVELIELLEPVSEPPPIALWPQTAGWVWLGLAVAGLLAYGVHKILDWRRANAYRRTALQELAGVSNDPAAIAQIVRRAALSVYRRTDVAALHGEAWLAFLDKTYGGNGFREGPGQALATAPYAQTSHADGLAELAAAWIRQHKADSA